MRAAVRVRRSNSPLGFGGALGGIGAGAAVPVVGCGRGGGAECAGPGGVVAMRPLCQEGRLLFALVSVVAVLVLVVEDAALPVLELALPPWPMGRTGREHTLDAGGT